jgi:hypothetical protein
MPVTAKLSKHFYDRLGDKAADELVEWFNQVDATYRTDLRELNELNFARFSAEVRAQRAEDRAWIEGRFAEARAEMNRRFAEFRAEVDGRFAELRAEMDRRFAELEIRIAALETRIERRFVEQTRFLYVALAAQLALIAGLYVR